MEPAREPAAPDPGLERLESLIETLADGVDGLLSDHPDGIDPGVVAGSSAQAQENRAIHISRARLAAERAREDRERLAELLEQVRAGLAHVRRQRERRQAGRIDRPEIPQALGAAMSEVTGAGDPDSALREVVRGAVAGIPGVDLAGISLRDRRGRLLQEIGSDDVAETLGARQSETGEGPGPEIARTGATVHVADLAADDVAWSAFAPVAVASGVRSVVAFPLLSDPGGALSLWSHRPRVFDESTRLLGDLFVRHASLAIGGAERYRNLLRAVDSRDLIGQAKGVLMARRGIPADEAFQLLVRSSQDTNIKLIDVARWVVEHLASPP